MKRNGNKYKELSKIELIQHIEELEEVIKQVEKNKNQNEDLTFPWISNLRQWNWMVKSNRLRFNEKKATSLGYISEKTPKDAGFKCFTTKLHPSDHKKTKENIDNI